MSDIIFDLKNNDIGTSNGDFAVVVDPSIQNATLMLLKNPVNILQPQFGVGFETFALNARPDYVSMLAATAKRQVIKDGADYCDIRITEGENFGEYSVSVDAQYPVSAPAATLSTPAPPPPLPKRGSEVKISVVVSDIGGYLSDVDIKLTYTLPNGDTSPIITPSSVEHVPDSSPEGYHDLYVFTANDATTGECIVSWTASKTGYHSTYSPYVKEPAGEEFFSFTLSTYLAKDS